MPTGSSESVWCSRGYVAARNAWNAANTSGAILARSWYEIVGKRIAAARCCAASSASTCRSGAGVTWSCRDGIRSAASVKAATKTTSATNRKPMTLRMARTGSRGARSAVLFVTWLRKQRVRRPGLA